MLQQIQASTASSRVAVRDTRAKEILKVAGRVRGALESGLRIAVLGWGKQQHNRFTRKLSDKQVVFHGTSSSQPSFGSATGYVLYTEFVDHCVTKGIKRTIPSCSFVLEPREIKTIFKSCSDLLTPSKKPKKAQGIDKANGKSHPAIAESVVPVGQAPPQEMSPEVALENAKLEILTRPLTKWLETFIESRSNQMEQTGTDKYAKLTRLFLNEANKNDGKVGKKTLTSKARLAGFTVKHINAKLVKEEWVEAVYPATDTGKQRQIGSYIAGLKMLDLAGKLGSIPLPPPTDPFKQAEWRIAKKPVLIARVSELQAETRMKINELEEELKRGTAEINAELTAIAELETAIGIIKMAGQTVAST